MAIFKNREEDLREIGFGRNVYEADQRLINKDGSSNVHRTGLPLCESLSFFHTKKTKTRKKKKNKKNTHKLQLVNFSAKPMA